MTLSWRQRWEWQTRQAAGTDEPRVRYVYVDCWLDKNGQRLEWTHLVAEGNAAETVRIVKRSGAKAKVRR